LPSLGFAATEETDMATKSTHDAQSRPEPPSPEENESKEEGSELAPRLPKDEHQEELIDEALTETFPASDPIAIPTPKEERKKK